MKRSKMIEIIFKRLGPVGICEETCDEVLALIEEAGMLPPMREHWSYDPGGYGGGYVLTGKSRTWETENDKT